MDDASLAYLIIEYVTLFQGDIKTICSSQVHRVCYDSAVERLLSSQSVIYNPMPFKSGSLSTRHNVTKIFTSTRRVPRLETSHTSSIRIRLLSKSSILGLPSSTPPRKVRVFLPHEQLDIKAHLKSAKTTTSSKGRTLLGGEHHDLKSYLQAHQHRLAHITDSDARKRHVNSTVYLGTRYEYLIHSQLTSQLSFSLTRVGGKGDGGVDLIGTWTLPEPASLPTVRRAFRVLCQAKRLGPKRTPGPVLMRELEGTVMSATSTGARVLSEAFVAHSLRNKSSGGRHVSSGDGDEEEKADLSHLPTMGILITTRPLSDGIEKAMARSRRPLMYMCLEEMLSPKVDISNSNEGGSLDVPMVTVRQMAWNAAASQAGLEGYGVVRKYPDEGSPADGFSASSNLDGEASLVFQGRPIDFPLAP